MNKPHPLSQPISWLTSALLLALPAALACSVGQLAHAEGLVDWDSLAAASHAYDVFFRQPQSNLALIGFAQPPLAALLYLPAAPLAPGWLASGGAAVALGAIFLALCAWQLAACVREAGLPSWLQWLLVGLLSLHPLTLSYAALGSPALVLLFTYLALGRHLLAWGRQEKVRDLIAAALYAAAAILIAYEAIVPVLAAAALIAWRCHREPGPTSARAEGTLITFLLPGVYVGGVWLLANWIIMGDPWTFWWQSTAGRLPVPLSPAETWISPLFAVVFTAQPLLLALLYQSLLHRGRHRTSQPVAWLALSALASPLVFWTLRTTAGAPNMWSAQAPVAVAALGLGLVLLVAVVGELTSETRRAERRAPAGFLIMAMGSLVVAYTLQISGQGLPVGVREALTGRVAFAHPAKDELRAAACFREYSATSNQPSVVAGWSSFAVGLYSHSRAHTTLLRTSLPSPQGWRLEAGSVLAVLTNRDPSVVQAWQRRLPWGLGLQEIPWSCEAWQIFFVTPAAPGPRGQAAPPGAIIAPEGDASHAHSGR